MRTLFFRVFGFITVVALTAANHSDFFDRLKAERVESEGDIVWSQVGPGNAGFANVMRYHPTIPQKVATIPDMWNAYQSDNNGISWYHITDSDGKGEFYHIRDLYYSPKVPEFGIAISSARMYQTHDTGRSWQIVPNCPWYKPLADGDDQESWKKKVASLAIDPNDENVWFVGEALLCGDRSGCPVIKPYRKRHRMVKKPIFRATFGVPKMVVLAGNW
ncbi:hypothetical protein [Persicobacter sp. CCB-QB2]|uniref:hypothetical protein n=1 Tax=Persicobacter sp. CCB-QB2 TaxID=1561025 RepID=UPI00209D40FD|nr:hypothetical protein [Persicobacter sp. CCB-QB2]